MSDERQSAISSQHSTQISLILPRLYPILDAALFVGERDPLRALLTFAEELLGAGVTLLQYRNKLGAAREVLSHARELKRITGNRAKLIMNDRADLCLAAGFDGVHLGQDDLSVKGARRVVGLDRVIGYSTHSPEQVSLANATSADYIALGPVFGTASKRNPDPVIGLDGVRQARELTRKPLVAIGGIIPENACEIIHAGADSVAVIAALRGSPGKTAGYFLRVLG